MSINTQSCTLEKFTHYGYNINEVRKMSIRGKATCFILNRCVSLNPEKNISAGKTIAALDKKSSGRRLSSRLVCESAVTNNGTRYKRVSLKGSEVNGKAIYYIHGGAFVAGLNPFYLELSSELIEANGGGEVIFLDYGTVPEHKYPAQLDEALDLWNEITRKLGYLPENVTVGGDSAGGNLTLALLLKLRDNGFAMPKCAFCISPWADMTASGDSYFFNYRKDVLFGDRKKDATEKLRQKLVLSDLFGYASDLSGELRRDPYVSPVFADYHGFPPMFFTVGGDEMLLCDTLRIAKKLKKANRSVTVDVGKGMFHIYALFFNYLPEARRSFDKLKSFIKNV